MGNLLCEFNKDAVQNQIMIKRMDLNLNLPKQLNFHKFQKILVFLDHGDIKEEEVDVIVCQTDVVLSLPNGLTHNMTEQAKKELTKELTNLKAKQNYVYGDVFFSHAEELQFDYLFYCVLPDGNDVNSQVTPQMQLSSQAQINKIKIKNYDGPAQKGQNQKYQKQYIYDCVIKCIKLAEELEINSLCLPLLTSINLSNSQVASMMLVTVKHYIEENQSKIKFLNTIRFCVQDQNHLEAFQWSFIEICKKQSGNANHSDNNSEASDQGAMEDIELQNNQIADNNIRDIRSLSQYNLEDDEFGSFGVSYQDKIQGGANVRLNRKGSL